jgi:hypothetical protein
MAGNFVEVYNENLNDLLGNPDELDKKKHEIRHVQIHSCNVGDGSFSPLHIMANFMLLLVQLIRVAQTHTMSSADGMIPRAVHQIYETAQGLEEKGWRYSMAGFSL